MSSGNFDQLFTGNAFYPLDRPIYLNASIFSSSISALRFFDNFAKNPDAYYEPNSFNGAVEDERYKEPPLKINGDADHYNHRDGNDDYCQPRALYELFDKEQKTRLYMNIAQAMQGVPQVILEK